MEKKSTINEKNAIVDLRMAIGELSSIEIMNATSARIKQKQLRGKIDPVMKTFLRTLLWKDENVTKLLLNATELENKLALKHTELSKRRFNRHFH